MVMLYKIATALSRRAALAAYIATLLALAACGGKRVGPLPVSATEGICPVCSMKVKADNQWTSEIIYKDGTKLMFETPGDMLKFRSSPDKYDVADAQKNMDNVERILLKEFQTRGQIDARAAALVYKSKVNGPMGPDVIAFHRSEEARAFAEANGGTVVKLSDLTPEMIENLRRK